MARKKPTAGHKPWLKLWCEWLDDPKVQMMSDAYQRRHICLMILKQRGYVPCNNSAVAFALRVSNDEWLKTKEEFVSRGLCDDENDIPSWITRQDLISPNTERSRRHRAKLKEAEKGRCGNVAGTLRERCGNNGEVLHECSGNSLRVDKSRVDKSRVDEELLGLCQPLEKVADPKPPKAKIKAKKKTNPDIAAFIKEFTVAFQSINHNEKPTWGAKGAGQVKALLRQQTLPVLIRRIANFAEHHKAGSFGADSFELGSFVTHLDKWAVPPKAKNARFVDPQELEMLGGMRND